MKIKILFLATILLLFFNRCVERYFLDEGGHVEPKLVVDALLSDKQPEQQIKIALSSSPELPKFNPLTGLTVYVLDEDGNRINFFDNHQPGIYEANMEKEYFHEGARFKLVIVNRGKIYESKWEEFLYCPPVDSIYYELKERATNNPNEPENGVQFYIDFKASNDYGAFYRFDVVESYEYHSSFEIDEYYIGHYVSTPDDYSLYTCYKTKPIDQIFTLSTQGFTENTYIKYHLHYVNEQTQRLLYQYSLLINQYSLSEDAYYYWETLKANNQESGTLFSSQPAQILGNIYNINDEKDDVLGYFGVSSVTSKRIVLKTVNELDFSKVPYCGAIPLEMPIDKIPSTAWPIYLVYRLHPEYGVMFRSIASKRCFDCREDGGVLEKPDFFD